MFFTSNLSCQQMSFPAEVLVFICEVLWGGLKESDTHAAIGISALEYYVTKKLGTFSTLGRINHMTL